MYSITERLHNEMIYLLPHHLTQARLLERHRVVGQRVPPVTDVAQRKRNRRLQRPRDDLLRQRGGLRYHHRQRFETLWQEYSSQREK